MYKRQGKQYANLAEKKNPWRDTQIRLTGACVATLDAYFMTDFLCAVRQRDWEYMVEYMKSLKLPPQQTSQNLCQFVVSGVDNDKEAAKMNYLSMIRSAKKKIRIQSPYFIPDASVLDALKTAAASGVEIELMIQMCIRDRYLAALFGLMVILLLLITKKQGVLTIATLVVNLGIYGAGFTLYLQGKDILKICNLMAILFMVTTLLFLNGFSRKTFAAVLSSFCVLALIMAIFFAVMNRVAEPDYSAMEYLGTIENPEDIFAAEVMLAGLGAIMDVAVTISAALSELLEKKPDLTFRSLFRSGREIGYDIMGTMISVLLFTFGSSLIPSFLIRMNNEVSFLTIVTVSYTHLSCECPFDAGRYSRTG